MTGAGTDSEAKIQYLRHLTHRLKNNLQVVASLLKMHQNFFDTEGDRTLFLAIQGRIKPMTLAYERLIQHGEHAFVEMDGYLRRLLGNLLTGIGIRNVTLEVSCAPGLRIELERAIPIGQIFVELVSNAAIHGYSGEPGIVRVEIGHMPGSASEANSGEYLSMSVRDWGNGLPLGLDPCKTTSFGFKLVQMLATQLKGTLHTSSRDGAVIEIRLPV
jgi:two-component sensor histidine kinase